MSEISIVGSGPNGLAAAVLLARSGLSVEVHEAAETIGGGTRSAALFESGVVHDLCSAVHPMAAASPFFRGLGLPVEWCRPEIAYGQPIDDHRTGLAYADLERTCERLGPDGARWRRLMAPLVEHSDEIASLLLGDLRRPPHDLRAAALLPLRILALGTRLDRKVFRGVEAPALLSGVIAHAMSRQPALVAGGGGLLLAHLAHAGGWVIPRGGSQVIADALAADLAAHGGKIHTGSRITDLRELANSRAVLLDVAPQGLLDMAGDLLPAGYRRALQRYRYGPGSVKVDFLVSDPIPWCEPELAKAGTVHIGGTREEVYAAENAVARGSRPDEPFMLVSDPMAIDPSRGRPGKRPVWAYCHVPHADPFDATDVIRRRIERFAPGFSDTILASATRTAPEQELHNPNYVGGDVAAGAVNLRQVLARPVPRWDTYRTPLSGVYLCSSATSPGPGVHGMCGLHAAKSVLRREFGIRHLPTGWADES